MEYFGVFRFLRRGARRLSFLAPMATCLLLAVGCGGQDVSKAIKEMAPVIAIGPGPLKLGELMAVSLRPGGQATVALNVDRASRTGPIAVTLGTLPDGITAPSVSIKEGESAGVLTITAAPTLGDADLEASIEVTATSGEAKATQPLRLQVPRFMRPEFGPVDKLLLQPGTKLTVNVPVRWNDVSEPFEIRLGAIPAPLKASITPLLANAESILLTVEADAGLEEGVFAIAVEAEVLARDIGLKIPVIVNRHPFSIAAGLVATLVPGQSKRVEAAINRQTYDGPFALNFVGLPQGVTMAPVLVPAGEATATLEVVADETATPGVGSAGIQAVAGHLVESQALVVRVLSKDEQPFAPLEWQFEKAAEMLHRPGGIGSRVTVKRRTQLGNLYGSSPEATAAVERGLAWLAKQQQPDGSWKANDDAATGVAAGDAFVNDRVPNTALALLPFLAEGLTHAPNSVTAPWLEEYRPVVKQGLEFLARSQQLGNGAEKGSLKGGIDGQIFGITALSEAYGLSADDRLKNHASQAVKYLVTLQHKRNGEWEALRGDDHFLTTGRAMLALCTARLSRISVSTAALTKGEKFMDSCAAGDEDNPKSTYCVAPGAAANPTATALGLLVRQYLGWLKNDPALLAGQEYLLRHPPPESGETLGDLDYYFFATQVMRNMEGESFDRWNHLIREHLLRTQEQAEEMAGSWAGQTTDLGGRTDRLYGTAIALMTLQVYYRTCPMYRPMSAGMAAPQPGDTPESPEAEAAPE